MGITSFYNCRGETVPFSELHHSDDSTQWDLPLPLVKSLSRQRRSYCDISITQLIGPPQIRLLKERHDYPVEPSSLIWASFGTAMHRMLELKSEAAAIAEEQLVAEFEVVTSHGNRTVRVGGTADHFDHDTLTNYKTSSVAKAKMIHDHGMEKATDWVGVENVYAFLFRRYGFEVQRLQVALLLRDWSHREKQQSLDKFHCSKCGKNHMRSSRPGRDHAEFEDKSKAPWYPATQVHMVELPLWTERQAEEFIMRRLKLHLEAEQLPDRHLPPCSQEETWTGIRCEHFCEVAHLCHQHRS